MPAFDFYVDIETLPFPELYPLIEPYQSKCVAILRL
jgi:hypothetical protein